MVGEVFRRVADNYDLMNDLMSAGIHRLWKDEFVRMLLPVHQPGSGVPVHLLDVAGGTGDIAFRIADGIRAAGGAEDVHITVCDINPSMLSVGEDRARERGYSDTLPTMSWLEGNAEHLPLESNSVDAYTISFGIRNVTNVDAALREAYRVLKPGGRFFCLEFSRVSPDALRELYDTYSFNVVPELGHWVANDRDSYQYLVESIRKFPKQDDFAQMIRDAGFKAVTHTDFSFGIVAAHSGFKWERPPL